MSESLNVFDGTNLITIKKSMADALGISTKELENLINLFIIDNIHDIRSQEFSIQNFFEYYKQSLHIKQIAITNFEKVLFFHKTSTIDDFIFIKKHGLLDLDELLTKPSPLNHYLKSKGIEFIFSDEFPQISIAGKVMPLTDLPCDKLKSSKRRILSRLIKNNKTIPLEGISGFLFLEDAILDPTYQYINRVPEFLIDLNNCMNGISDDWETVSTQAIIKIKVDAELWFSPDDFREQKNIDEKSNQIAIEAFTYLLQSYSADYYPALARNSSAYYPFIAYGNGIPPDRILEIINHPFK